MRSKVPLFNPIETGALLYLLAPLVIFATTFARWEVAIPSCALVLALIVEITRLTARQSLKELISWEDAYLLSFTVVWVGFLFAVGTFHQVGDWSKHYAVLNLLRQNSWPPVKVIDGIGVAALRYYVGWYLVPATVLKLTGGATQLIALFIWSVLGVFIFLRLVRQILCPRSSLAVIAFPVIIALFDVPNVLGRLATRHWLPHEFALSPWWAGWISYVGNSVSLAWVPQHSIGGWVAIALLMRQRDQGSILPYSMLLLCGVALWSPFSAIGLLPFLGALAFRYGLYPLFTGWRALASLAMLGVPIALYLGSDLGGVPSGFILFSPCLAPGICFSWLSYMLFILIEVSPLLVILSLRGEDEKGFLAAAAVALLLIPFYKMGMINDFGVRASLPALMVVCILCTKCVLSGPLRYSLGVGILLLAAMPDFKENVTAVLSADKVQPNSTMQTITAGEDPAETSAFLHQYFARVPVWVLRENTHESVKP